MVFGLSQATINVLIGAVIGMFTSTFLNWNQRRVQRDRFRRSLLHEIDHIADELTDMTDDSDRRCAVTDHDAALVMLTPDIVEADLRQMSSLTSQELEHVYEFYERVRLLRTELKRARNAEHDPEILYDHARQVVRLRERVQANMKRSRLSRFTEWYKSLDRQM